MVELYIGTKNVEESNLFFRKLWSELDSICTNGWNFCPSRSGQRISIGYCNLGEVSFTYKEKGSIEFLYIDADDSTGQIMEALIRARSDFYHPNKYYVSLKLESKKAVSIESIYSRNAAIETNGDNTELCFMVSAYSKLDLHHLLANKMAWITYLLSEYTHTLFSISHISYSATHELKKQKFFSPKSNYSYEWFDTDERPVNESQQVVLPDELMELINQVIERDTYNENLQLLLNSAQLFYWSLHMINNAFISGRAMQPGYLDIINSILISSLEPLSNIGAPKPEVCEFCGNIKYSIVKKVRDLTKKYLNEHISNDISKRAYRNRSAFLHSGVPMTYEHFSGSSFPPIDANRKNEMAMYTHFEYNIKDYISYIFRKMVVEYIIQETMDGVSNKER